MRETKDVPLFLKSLPRVAYEISDLTKIMTPALVIYPELVAKNVEFTLRLLGGNPGRWRPHVKTAKLEAVMKLLVQHGVTTFKCATTLELQTACEAGATDVLVAYPTTGPNAVRVRQIAEAFMEIKISLVDAPTQLETWEHSRVGLFVDINPGMDRTEIEHEKFADILTLVRAIEQRGLRFCGLHFYEGHLFSTGGATQVNVAHHAYDQLLATVEGLETIDIRVREVITSGTPSLPAALAYEKFTNSSFIHRVSAGTIVYGDMISACQLPENYEYRPAALVVSRVISHSRAGIVTCDAGHKSLAVDAGIPNCCVVGEPRLRPLKPSEEHLPIEVPSGVVAPALGEVLYLLPRHVCPTVNNFDHALFVRRGKIQSLERVSSRGHEAPAAIVN